MSSDDATAPAVDQRPAAQPTAQPVIRVLVASPTGRLGRLMMEGLPAEEGLKVVGGLRRGDPAAELFATADVLVDFTNPDSAPDLLLAAIEAGVHPVSGTSSMRPEALDRIDAAARERGIAAVWCSHFRFASLLMNHLVRIVARYLDSVEIIEAHRPQKADAPSGKAWDLANIIRAERGTGMKDAPVKKTTLDGVRGGVVDGIHVHSVRLPALLGWHEVIFAGEQELLTIRHDDLGLQAYVPAVARAVRAVVSTEEVGLIRGYERIIGLPDISAPPAG